jgi:hypothetical protein
VVDGPLKAMNSLSGLYTDYIELDGRMENFSSTVHILNRDPLLVIRGEGIAEFRGFIQGLIMIRTLENLPVSVLNLDSRLTAELETKSGSIRVEGNQNELEAYEASAFVLSLDCDAIQREGTYKLPLSVEVPQGIGLIHSDPEEITVHIRTGEN